MLKWLQKFWVVLVVVGGLILWWVFRRKEPPPSIKTELEVVDAKLKTKKILIEHGKDEALKQQDEQYSKILEAMDASDKEKAKALEADPVERHAFILRAGKR